MTPIVKKALRVKIADLPQGYYKEQLLTFAENDQATVWVVAVPGNNEDWSAYIGWPEFEHLKPEFQKFGGNAEYYSGLTADTVGTASYGDKLSEREARELFKDYEISKLSYRS